MGPSLPSHDPRHGHIQVDNTRMYFRDVGEGHPIIVLHGGPDFDHNYLLPEMDSLAASFRVIYYDQRGRGRSAEGVSPGDVGLSSEMDDLDAVRRHFDLESVALLGHSWGGVLAMEYAVRHPDRVSHLVLMNTAPASHRDLLRFRQHMLRLRPADDIETMEELSSSPAFGRGSLDAEARYYRVHFRIAVRQPEHLELIIGRLRAHFTEETVLVAREIEQRLYDQTWKRPEYDLVPRLRRLDIPTLVIHGDGDVVPVEVAARIAEAIPGAILFVLGECGHFAYLDHPDKVLQLIADLIRPGDHRS